MFLFIGSFINSFIAGKIFIFMFIRSFMFLCIDSFIDSFIAGKTMGNLRNRRTVGLVTSEEKWKKLTAQPSFKQFNMFSKNLAAAEQAKVELLLNQPIFVGFAILDYSKMLMYDLHYNYIKSKYPDSALLFTDTDSLRYQLGGNSPSIGGYIV